MTKKDIEKVRKETIDKLNKLLDDFKDCNQMAYIMQVNNLERLVEHMKQCYELEKEFP